jgi:hypothetical protein
MTVEALVSFRDRSGSESTAELSAVETGMMANAAPWRVFRWRQGQAHYSGWYWSSTTGGHVVYESRLELARLLLADFDPNVVAIAAQPFCVAASAGDRVRRHVPDFLLVGADGLVRVVNVKPAEQLAVAKVAEALEWAGKLFAGKGWQHEIWSGAGAVELANVRFLAGYRRADRVDTQAVSAVEELVTAPVSIGSVEESLSLRFPVDVRRPALLHLLWRGVLRAELDQPLSASTVLERAA